MIKTALNVVRDILALCGVAAILVLGGVWFFFSGPSWSGQETEEFRLSSPSREYDAVVTVQEPGAVGSSTLRLYVVPAGVPFNKRDENYKWEVFRSHTVLVDRLKWRDDRRLLVIRRPQDQIQYFDPVRYDLRDIRPNEAVQASWRRVTIVIQTDETL